MGSALGVAVVGTLLTARFVAGLPPAVRTAGHGHAPPHTVADALAAAGPPRHHAVIHAFTAGSAGALRTMSLIVLAAGALVIAQLLWSRGDRAPSPAAASPAAASTVRPPTVQRTNRTTPDL